MPRDPGWIVTPFLVVRLFTECGVAGVLTLMVGLLSVPILAVATLGIEPRRRSLEDLRGGAAEREAVPTPAIIR